MKHLTHDLTGISRISTVLLVLLALVSLAVGYSSYESYAFAKALIADSVPVDQINGLAAGIDERAQWFSIAYTGVFVLTAIASGIWIHRAACNANELQPDTRRITPGWSVGWFFVPLANYWMPYQAIRQTWNTSADPMGDINRGAPTWVAVWWALWVLANILGSIELQLAKTIVDPESLLSVSRFMLITSPLILIVTALYIQLIRRITQMQSNARLGVEETFA
jgi:hypothetical protein